MERLHMNIDELIREWKSLTDAVIEFKNIETARLRWVFAETEQSLAALSNDNLVPKQAIELLLEINDFGWWVSSLNDTPLHEHYQELLDWIADLKQHFCL